LDGRRTVRVRITNKVPIPFEDTVKGLQELLRKVEERKIPENAQVYFRGQRIAEFMWSSLDDNQV
jgi:hypothetical protein